MRREFHRIGRQVEQDLADAHRVADVVPLHLGRHVNIETDGLLFGPRPEQRRHACQYLMQIERLGIDLHTARFDFRNIQNIVEDFEQRAR